MSSFIRNVGSNAKLEPTDRYLAAARRSSTLPAGEQIR